MLANFDNALIFLITTIFNLYLYILMIRLLLAYAFIPFFDPFVQFVVKLTDGIIKPLRYYLPNIKRVELASLVLIFMLEIIKFSLISLINLNSPNPLGLIVLAFADMCKLILDTFMYAIFFQVILSWLQPTSPINRILFQMTSPLMRPIRRLIPPVAGFDISPIPALIILQILYMLLVVPLMMVGAEIAWK
jgi:YggT family protein